VESDSSADEQLDEDESKIS
jgi:hypothetical protein